MDTKPSLNAVEVRELCALYGKRTVLSNISFTIPPGQIVTLLGPSGCGKSTLLKHLIGLYKPSSGDILLYGRSIVHADDRERQDIMRHFGVAYQGGALFRSLSVGDNIALPMQEYTDLTEDQIRRRVSEKLSLVGLEGKEKLMPAELSGGMIKRAAFARALALDPEILFFDEPSAGLDPLSSRSLDRLILDIREKTNTTILVVTHELESIFTISDRAIMLSPGSKGIIADGPVDELIHSSNDFVREFLNGGSLPRRNRTNGSNISQQENHLYAENQ